MCCFPVASKTYNKCISVCKHTQPDCTLIAKALSVTVYFRAQTIPNEITSKPVSFLAPA